MKNISETQQTETPDYFIRPSNSFPDCWSVYRKGKVAVLISANFSEKENAESLVEDLSIGKITEYAARKQSVAENDSSRRALWTIVHEQIDN